MDELVLKRMKTPNLLPKPLIGVQGHMLSTHNPGLINVLTHVLHFLPSKKFVRPCPAVLVYRTKHELRKGTP
ncbi:hypothetical protein CsSME_00028289 [Camellia sinensis var. sinensis]